MGFTEFMLLLLWFALCASSLFFSYYVLPILHRIPKPNPSFPAIYFFSYLIYRGEVGQRVQTGSGWTCLEIQGSISDGDAIKVVSEALVEKTREDDPLTTSVTLISWQRMEKEN
jgi:hypothetical protein